MVSLELEPEEIRKKVEGTILAELYDETVKAMEKVFTDSYWPQKHTAEMVADCYNVFVRHNIEVPKKKK